MKIASLIFFVTVMLIVSFSAYWFRYVPMQSDNDLGLYDRLTGCYYVFNLSNVYKRCPVEWWEKKENETGH